MSENPYEPPQEVNDWARRSYKFQWWPAASFALLVFAAILALAEVLIEGRVQKFLPARLIEVEHVKAEIQL